MVGESEHDERCENTRPNIVVRAILEVVLFSHQTANCVVVVGNATSEKTESNRDKQEKRCHRKASCLSVFLIRDLESSMIGAGAGACFFERHCETELGSSSFKDKRKKIKYQIFYIQSYFLLRSINILLILFLI